MVRGCEDELPLVRERMILDRVLRAVLVDILPERPTTQDVPQLRTTADAYLRKARGKSFPILDLAVIATSIEVGSLPWPFSVEKRIDIYSSRETEKIEGR